MKPEASALPFRLYLVSDRSRMGPDPAGAVAALIQAGLRAFQWREKDLTPAENLQKLREIVDAARGIRAVPPAEGAMSEGAPAEGAVHFPWQIAGTQPAAEPSDSSITEVHHRAPHGPARDSLQLFINERADLALAVGCHLHLAESSIPTGEARRLLPRPRLIGRSTHSLAGAQRAAHEGADFITFGPVYDTSSKRAYGFPAGIEALREVCRQVAIPVFALGGVSIDRVPECLAAGAHGVAMIGAVWDAADRTEAVREITAILEEC